MIINYMIINKLYGYIYMYTNGKLYGICRAVRKWFSFALRPPKKKKMKEMLPFEKTYIKSSK